MSAKDPTETVDQKELLRALLELKRGNFAYRMPEDRTGLGGKIADTFNAVAELNQSSVREIDRLGEAGGKQGNIKARVPVTAAVGDWAVLVEAANTLMADMAQPMTELTRVIGSVSEGDLSQSMPLEVEGRRLKGEFLSTAKTVNTMVTRLNTFASEVTRVAREVGTDGKLGGQADVKGVSGTWKDLTDNVNLMASNLTTQVRNIAEVTVAVAAGDLSKKITADVRGEFLNLKDTINTMVDQLRAFASEVTRVAREVGTDGKLGGQADVKGVGGTWKDPTDSVNFMAGNRTSQVRNIAGVTTAVANGDLTKKITVDVKGELLDLKSTINTMVDQLNAFAAEVTRVAREVGTDGKLGGQAQVRGVSGTWKDLTDNVNFMAGNLTDQVRGIAKVVTAVANLKETTEKNTEQDWLNSNLAKFTRMLQGQKDLLSVARMLLSELAPVVSAQHGVFYGLETSAGSEPRLKLLSTYAFKERKNLATEFRMGEGLVGQCAIEKQRILLTNVPSDYIQVTSGLGEAKPLNIIVLPVVFENQVRAVIELASFERFSATHQMFLDQLAESLGIVVTSIEANMRTEDLLKQSQSMALDLKSQQEELQQTNEELEEKAKLLAAQKDEVELKNREIDVARATLEEKAAQLALSSKYKSEFLSNMSHELRTPLNSLLLLSRQLADNAQGNLDEKQVKFARTIQSSGNDLLTLINDILDLSKIESGTANVEIADVFFPDIARATEKTFRHVAEGKGLEFSVTLDESLPPTIGTDPKRALQILKNLLSNAFKFTERGSVTLTIALAERGWSLNAIPKKSYFSEYSSRITRVHTAALLAAFQERVHGDVLFPGRSFNLDFHSVPFHGDDPLIERHYVAMRSRRQKSVLAFLAQDAEGQAFCYSNADLRKGEEANEIFSFIAFWKKTRGERPRHLVFDSRLTTYANLARLDQMDITFITLRRRSPKLLKEIALLPRSAWRTVELDVPSRKYKTPRVHEQKITLEGREFRQMFIEDLGHDEPTILLTNELRPAAQVITRYAQRMLIENALSDAVRFFHMNALSSSVGLKVDFDMALLVVASGLYRLVAQKMRGYRDAQARQIFRDLIDMPATVAVSDEEVLVRFHRRAHLPIVLASGLLNSPVNVPWWGGRPLRFTA